MYKSNVMTLIPKAVAGLCFYLLSSMLATSLATNLPDSKEEYIQHQLLLQQPLNGVHMSEPSSKTHEFVGKLKTEAPVWVYWAPTNDLLDASTDLPPWNVSAPEFAQEAWCPAGYAHLGKWIGGKWREAGRAIVLRPFETWEDSSVGGSTYVGDRTTNCSCARTWASSNP